MVLDGRRLMENVAVSWEIMVFAGEYLCCMENADGNITVSWRMLVSEGKMLVFDKEWCFRKLFV